MNAVNILFLPSGPGLNSGPARVFLGKLFTGSGEVVFWNEPSVQRGDEVLHDDLALWEQLVKSLESAARNFSGPFVIVTESFGSILAEILYARLEITGEKKRVLGILHSPPVLDLLSSFRTILSVAERLFSEDGDNEKGRKLSALRLEFEADPRLGSPALHRGLALASESPRLLPLYFRSSESLGRWASGFDAPGFSPEPEMRDRILRGMERASAPTRMSFSPDVPTVVCGGGFDPYQSLSSFVEAIRIASAIKRRHPIEWRPFPEAGHYPHAESLERWQQAVWHPFVASLGSVNRS